MISNKTDI